MNNDIVDIMEFEDLVIRKTETPRAANVLSTQLGSLEYLPNFGIDLRYFLESEFRLQNASFKAYCVERLLSHQINVVNVLETVETLFTRYIFEIGESNSGTELIA